MLLHFSKRLCLLIRSSSVRINFQLLPIISVVTFVGVSLATASSASDKCSSSTSASSSSENFSSLSFSWLIPIYIRWSSIILVFSPIFLLVYHVFFVTVIFNYLSCQLRLSRILTFDFLVLSYLTLSSCHVLVFIILLISWTVVTWFLFVLHW